MGLSDCIFEPSDQDYDYVDSAFIMMLTGALFRSLHYYDKQDE